MAGAGSRFAEKGYINPKPLIDVFDKKMIDWVISNFNSEFVDEFVFIVRKEHVEDYTIDEHLRSVTNLNAKIVTVDYLTEGAACTTLLAEDFIDKDKPLIMANSDQYVVWNIEKFIFHSKELDGNMVTFWADNPKWSYAKVNQDGFVEEVAEKKLISNEATVGIYYWAKGSDYVKYAKQMISKNIRTNNEFYVCPVFNEAIQDNKKIGAFQISTCNMWGLGTPEDLEIFLKDFKK
jgi:dTDP-glucose pyrophosphorylase